MTEVAGPNYTRYVIELGNKGPEPVVVDRFELLKDFTPGGALVCPTTVPEWARIQAPAASWWKNVAPAGHVVVKVAPGGGSYRIYILDSATEDMRIKYVYQSKPL